MQPSGGRSDMLSAWIWHYLCMCVCACEQSGTSKSWSGKENHRDLPGRQQFNEAYSYLNKSARSPSWGVHSFILFSFFFSRRVLHEYFIPSAPLPAQQPVTLRADSQNAATLPIWCGGVVEKGRGGVKNISEVNFW